MTTILAQAGLAGLHYLTLGLGFAGVVLRGVRLRDLRRAPDDPLLVASLLRADTLWGIAAALWLATGLTRAFGGLEKGAAFYTRNAFFFVKMGLFVAVLLLEIRPMVTFIRWRAARARGAAPVRAAELGALIKLNDLEIVVLALIPFVASLMARGAWLF